jgi:hypothetical protein
MNNIDESRLEGEFTFLDAELKLPGEIKISAALCVKNAFDESGVSLGVVETLKGNVWRMTADKSWSSIQGKRELTAMLIVPVTDNEALIDENWSDDFQREMSNGIIVRLVDWFVVDSLPDGRNVVEAKINGVSSEHQIFSLNLKDLIDFRYEAELGA